MSHCSFRGFISVEICLPGKFSAARQGSGLQVGLPMEGVLSLYLLTLFYRHVDSLLKFSTLCVNIKSLHDNLCL